MRSITDTFIDAVLRRMIVAGFVEQFGRGLLAASLLSILLVSLAIWQSMPTLPILLLAALVGIIAGIVLAILHWPSRRDAAAAADRQLRLDDLLATAISCAGSTDEFVRALRGMADARCASHSPSEVVFGRLRLGSWGAIALAMSIATTLAVIPFGPARSRAVDANAAVLLTSSDEPPMANSTQANKYTRSVNNDPALEESSNISSSTEPHTDPWTSERDAQGGGKSQGVAGIGGGTSTTVAKPGADSRSGESAGRLGDANGIVAGGGAAANGAASGHDTANQTVEGSARTNPPVPAWSAVGGSTYESAVGGSTPGSAVGGSTAGAAGSTTGTGSLIYTDRVPPQHRDLVRDFFNRQ